MEGGYGLSTCWFIDTVMTKSPYPLVQLIWSLYRSGFIFRKFTESIKLVTATYERVQNTHDSWTVAIEVRDKVKEARRGID